MRTPEPPGLFKPTTSRSESKAQATDSAARDIMRAEAARRDAKTAKLRAARLAREAAEPPVPAAAKAKPRRSPAKKSLAKK